MSQDWAKQPSFARGLIFLAVIGVAVLAVAAAYSFQSTV